jgi:hypothetical protein
MLGRRSLGGPRVIPRVSLVLSLSEHHYLVPQPGRLLACVSLTMAPSLSLLLAQSQRSLNLSQTHTDRRTSSLLA